MSIPIGAMTGKDRKRIEAVAVATRIHLANAKVESKKISVHEVIEDAERIVKFYNKEIV